MFKHVWNEGTLERVGHLLPEKLTLSKSIWSKNRLPKESKQRLIERLKIIKAAWLQGGGLPQSWFNENGTKIMKLSRILEGLAQFKSDVVPLPAGLPVAALVKDFNFHRCLDKFGLKSTLEDKNADVKCIHDGFAKFKSDWMPLPEGLPKTAITFMWSKEKFHRESKQRLVERLKVIKTAWIKGGGLPQKWFNEKGTKRMKLSRILEGLAQFKSDVVPLPAGLAEATLVKDFNFHRCLDMFGLKSTLEENNADVKYIHEELAQFKSDWMPLPEGLPETAITLIWSKEKFHRESKQRLVERLKVIKTAWIKGGGSPQNWFNENGTKMVTLSRILEGLTQFKSNFVPLPSGLPEATLGKKNRLPTLPRHVRTQGYLGRS